MINSFTNNPTIKELVKRAEQLKADGKRFSDMEDSKGNQYVDLVQEGGGVLGIALVGYTYILEHAGIRFFSLAGTSAGAINTMLIAGMGEIGEPVSEKIIKVLSSKNLFDFVDGNKHIRRLIQRILKKKKGIGWALIFNAVRIYKTLKYKLGLNPGIDFEEWITTVLKNVDIKDMKDLNELRKKLPEGLHYINKKDQSELIAKLAIISSDITTHTKSEFPRMAGLYWEDTDTIKPSRFVRASMSIPFFFVPMLVKDIPDAGAPTSKKWYDLARYSGPVPDKVRFVDGGMLSNFPIDVFHRSDNKLPGRPTFGARLSAYRENYSNTDNLLGMSGAMISTMRQIYDYEFLLKHPDFSRLICRIDADQEFNWLDFNMKRKEQIELFNLGAKKAIEFLEGFKWDEYKSIRQLQIQKSV